MPAYFAYFNGDIRRKWTALSCTWLKI
jgi:hypothetical protein